MTVKLSPRQKLIVRRAREGVPPSEIARRLGITARRVSTILSDLRRAGVEIPKAPTCVRVKVAEVSISQTVLASIRPIAKRRGLTSRQLAERIIRGVLARNLVSELVDDDGKLRS